MKKEMAQKAKSESDSLWHDFTENPFDTPKITSWYVCKVRSSNELVTVYGYETIKPEIFDAWRRIDCPI